MVYNVAELIEAGWKKPYTVDPSGFPGAYSLVQNAVSHGGITVLQGPPGTGKTTLYEGILHDNLEKLANGNPIIYVAPTNQLVADMLVRMAATYNHLGKNRSDLLSEVRIFGSHFIVDRPFAKMRQRVNTGDGVKLVITTDMQRAARNVSDGFHMMIDEASKSPLQKPFVSIAEPLIRSIDEGRSIIDSVSVIGDPKQAISLGDQYRKYKERLVMNSMIRGLLPDQVRLELDSGKIDPLDAAFNYLKGKNFEFLDTSWRMPGPSEEPISVGYYSGRLRAKFRANEVLNDLVDRNNVNQLRAQSTQLGLVATCVEAAIDTRRPMIYAKVDSRYNDEYSPYDPVRAQLGVQFAVALAAITRMKTGVLTVYVQQMNQMQLVYKVKYRELLRRMGLDGLVSFSTTHRMLGSERANIVAILGKEHTYGEDYNTTYYREPELLNVQLSRHTRMLVIVGNLTTLVNSVNTRRQAEGDKYRELKLTAEEIHRQSGIERGIGGRFEKRREGNGCVYAPFN